MSEKVKSCQLLVLQSSHAIAVQPEVNKLLQIAEDAICESSYLISVKMQVKQ